jgi:hypothetical protein
VFLKNGIFLRREFWGYRWPGAINERKHNGIYCDGSFNITHADSKFKNFM